MKRKRAIAVLLCAVFLLVFSYSAVADELSEAKEEKKNIDNQLNDITQQKKQEISETQKLEQEKKAIQDKENKENQEYNELIKEIEELNRALEELDQSIEEAEKNYQHQLELFQVRLRAMYVNSNETALDMLLQSKNLTDFLERLELISLISKRDRQIVQDLSLAKQEVEYKRQLREVEKIETQKMAQEKKDRLDSLIASRSELERQIQENKNKIALLENQEKELLKKSEEMTSLIQALSKRSKYVEGQMVWPLQYTTTITSKFGNRKHPILRRYSMHTGIDIGGKSGESILAANHGTVILAGWQDAYGNTVVIDHGGGITTLYAHCSKILVRKGDEVKAGHVIAKVGSTGWSTGPHLHFEVRVDGEPKNPLNYVKP
jgi:murein DD-endopeptidase MepM/ murein hydrolase activator NlpD